MEYRRGGSRDQLRPPHAGLVLTVAWSKDWTIETVENNYRVLGMIDPEDIEQLIADAKRLRHLCGDPVSVDYRLCDGDTDD